MWGKERQCQLGVLIDRIARHRRLGIDRYANHGSSKVMRNGIYRQHAIEFAALLRIGQRPLKRVREAMDVAVNFGSHRRVVRRQLGGAVAHEAAELACCSMCDRYQPPKIPLDLTQPSI